MSIFAKFLGHHIKDIESVVNIIGTIVARVPLDGSDKKKIDNAIETLKTTTDNIDKSIKDVKDVYDIKPDSAELRNIIREELPAIIREVLADIINPKNVPKKVTK